MHNMIQRVQEGSGRDPDLGVTIAQAIGWYAPEGVDEDAWANENEMLAIKEQFIKANIQHDLFDRLRGPGLCLAVVREKLPLANIYIEYCPNENRGRFGYSVTIDCPDYGEFDDVLHPELPRAILIALLTVLENA